MTKYSSKSKSFREPEAHNTKNNHKTMLEIKKITKRHKFKKIEYLKIKKLKKTKYHKSEKI